MSPFEDVPTIRNPGERYPQFERAERRGSRRRVQPSEEATGG